MTIAKTQQAAAAAARETHPAADGFAHAIDRIAGHVTAQCRADAVFGTPISSDGVLLVPVVHIVGAFGAGAGLGAGAEEKRKQGVGAGGGIGGGGTFVVTPVGAFTLAEGKAEFRRVKIVKERWSLLGALASWLRSRVTPAADSGE